MKLKWLKDKLGEKFYPIAHATGVVVTESKTLDSKLYEIDTEIGNKANKAEMMDIKMLGWSVPKECPVQNEVNGNQFVQKVGRVDLGSLEWEYDASSGHERFKSTNALIKLPELNSVPANIYTNGYSTNSADDVYSHKNDKSISIGVGGTLSVYDSFYTAASTFKQAMQGQYLYYELATPITTTIDGNEIGETVGDVRKETTVNLLNANQPSSVTSGVTKTNNGDGTYTIQGTATQIVYTNIGRVDNFETGVYKLTGIKVTSGNAFLYVNGVKKDGSSDYSILTENTKPISLIDKSSYTYLIVGVAVANGVTVDETIKPMLTTNLSATYDDFVPYTGDTGSLNGDVADLRGDVDGFGDEFVTKRIQLLANFTSDYYRYIEPVAGKNQILVPPIIVNGTATSFDSSGGDEVSGANYSYAPRESVKMDILDVEVSSSVTQEGITVKFLDKRLDLSKLYNVTGKATSDIEIPLYSVTNPKNDYLYFITDSVSKMSSDTFYIKISDSSGNETTLGTDGSKKVNTHLKPGGKVTVYLVVKSGITVKQYVNVKCGYSSSDCIADFSPRKYSDTIDNVLDAIFDLNSRLKALENK